MVHLNIPTSFQRPSTSSNLEKSGGKTTTGYGMNETKSVLMFMFYKPPPEDSLVNRTVAWLDGPFSHVEIGFPDGMASSIFAGEKVFMHPRTFANPNYTTVSIQVTLHQMKMARKICVESAGRDIQFDSVGMYMVGMPSFCKKIMGLSFLPSRDRCRETTFCSKYVAGILKETKITGFTDVDTSSVSPSMVYRILIQNCNLEVITITPYKRKLLSDTNVFFMKTPGGCERTAPSDRFSSSEGASCNA